MKNKVEVSQTVTVIDTKLIRGLKRAKNGINYEIVAEKEVMGNICKMDLMKEIANMLLTDEVEMVSTFDNFRMGI